MKHLKIFETFKLGIAFADEENSDKIDVDGIEVILINLPDWIKFRDVLLYTVEMMGGGALYKSPLCFDNLNSAKNYIKSYVHDEKCKDLKFVIRTLSLSKGNVLNNIDDTQFETPPKWVKNPKSWAMDKMVTLLTPESKIHQLATLYVDLGAFSSKELDTVKSIIKSIYQSCKNKKELDVKDHARIFGKKVGFHHWNDENGQLKGDKDKIDLAKKFDNLLSYFYK